MITWPDTVPVHPAAELFPLLDDADLTALAEDIRAHGLLTPITRDPDDRILDGRNRFLACQQIGVTPTYAQHEGDPWVFVISANLHRRHLTDGQRAMVAAKIADRANGQRSRSPASSAAGDLEPPSPTQTEAAHLLDVTRGQVQRARQVITHGTEELKTLVENGSVPVATAARVATTLPADEQNAFAEQVREGANPRHVAPPEPRAVAAPKPVTPEPEAPIKRGRRQYRRHETLDADMIERLVSTLDGYRLGLADVTGIDPAVTSGQAARWASSLTKNIASLTKFRKLLQERSA